MIAPYEGVEPRIAPSAFVADSATVIGRVTIGEASSIWYGAVARGDVGTITIGERTNVQDLSVIHVSYQTADTTLGNDITVGHNVVLHGCTIEDHVLVGMGAILLDNCHIEPWCFIGAGALVTPRTRIPSGSLVIGSPARVVRPINPEERAQIEASGARYLEVAKKHAAL